jgi:predicted secreted protein
MATSSGAISGVGTELRRWNSTSGVWEALAEIKSISGPSMSRGTSDTTTLDTTGGYKTFIGAFRDPGTVSCSMNFTRSAYDQMKADFEDDAVKNYEIVLPDDENTTIEFEGLVTELPLTIPTDGVITADVTIKVSGEVTIESGSGPSAGA